MSLVDVADKALFKIRSPVTRVSLAFFALLRAHNKVLKENRKAFCV